MPPKKNKKPSASGYWEFVLECRSKPNNKNLSQEELKNYASKKWNVMSKEERQPYEERAKLAKGTFTTGKLTSSGREVETVERSEKEKGAKIQDMKNEISKLIKAAHFSLTLSDQTFLLIHMNHLAHHSTEDKYFICEIGIAALSLKDGIEDVFHRIVYPGNLPLGYAAEAMLLSKQTHQLYSLVMDPPIQNNVEEVFTEMRHFLKNHSRGSSVPILYTAENLLEMTRNVLDDFLEEFGYGDEIKVYSLQYLLHTLKNTAANEIKWASDSFSHSVIEKDVYSCCTGIGCEFHEVADNSLFCSQSIVHRYGYTLCDHCCTELGIKLVPGLHVPAKAKVETESRATSQAPSVSSRDGYSNATRGRIDSFGAASYESSFPALGSQVSSASSVVSFSSMQSAKRPSASSKAAARIEQSFKAYSLNEAKRDPRNLNFPEHRFRKPQN